MKKLIRNRLSTKCTTLLLIMAMLFSVTCVFPSYSEGETASRSLVSGTNFADGVYVLNNRLTGQFLSSNGSSLSMASGSYADIQNTIKFSINYVAGGYYDIRVNSNFYCLTRSTTTSNKNITLSPSLNGQYSMWKIGTYTVNNYTYHYFQNAQTNEYLTWQNGALKVTSSLGYPASETFFAGVWQVAKFSDYVHPTSITILDMAIPFGSLENPVIKTTPSNADFCEPYNFTYTCNTTYVGVDALNGILESTTYTGVYLTTVTATHKATGISTTFKATTNPRAILVGVDAGSNHDHSTSLSAITTDITNSGYFSARVETGEFTIDEIDSFLDSYKNSLFISRSHGDYFSNSFGAQLGTGILLTHERDELWYSSQSISSSLNLSNMNIVAFVGCYTGRGSINLPSGVVDRGARVAIGFNDTINCARANNWTEDFIQLLSAGYTVDDAIYKLEHPVEDDDPDYSDMQARIFGDGSTTLT